MRRPYVIIIVLALAAGALTLTLLTGFIQPQTVVVAKHDLAAGTRLSANLLEERRVPRAAVPPGAFASGEEAVGLVLTAERVAGDVLTSYVAGDAAAAAGLPSQLAPDNVAIAVKVDQATGLAGIVRAGQRVAVIAVLDPQAIQREAGGINAAFLPTPELAAETSASVERQSTATPAPTSTPQPPLSPVASITIKGLRVLVVPQSFRYEELPSVKGEADLFASARTSQSAQSGSVILLEAPLAPVQIAPGLRASPAELLALLNQVAVIHLALEPSDGLQIETAALKPVDLANLYERITGFELNR
jgi:Flp pilus assembly protein CpaB